MNETILTSAEWISQHSQHVSISTSKLAMVAQEIQNQIQQKPYSIHTWKSHPLHPQIGNKKTIDQVFLMDLLNFSFWSDQQDSSTFVVSLDGVPYTGYWTLCACIQRALRNGIPITSPNYYAQIDFEKAQEIFQSDDPYSMESMPLLKERVHVMNKAGKILQEKYNSSFVNCLIQCDHSAQSLLDILWNDFEELFQDGFSYKERRVYFMKRAQILIADLWALLEGKELGYFKDIDSLTIFADYRIPQWLVYKEILCYSDHLHAILKSGSVLPSGDALEIEIRGCSIWACELLKRELESLGVFLNSVLLDFYIWDDTIMKKKNLMKDIPFHKTRSIYY